MKKLANALGIAALGCLMVGGTASGQSQSPPVAANAYIVFNFLDWVWASPCENGGCSSIVFVDGFHYASVAEWALRPGASDFLDPAGNFAGSGGQMRCGSPWFDVTYNHCDYDDGQNGFINSGPGNLGSQPDNPNSETWLVREEGNVSNTPEPATFGLLGTGLVGLFGVARRRRNRSKNANLNS